MEGSQMNENSHRYIVYLTTNLINDMVYAGIHDMNSRAKRQRKNYFGSGSYFKRAEKNTGRRIFPGKYCGYVSPGLKL